MQKKAYQLGIKKIFYIDPYPGIANSHILSIGEPNARPDLILFSGAIGRAYHQLYQPILPYKDELQMLLGFEWPSKSTESENEQLKKKNERLESKNKELERRLQALKNQMP